MWSNNWQSVANVLAGFAQREFVSVPRGALLFPFGEGALAAAVFGNDNYAADDKVKFEVDAVRHCLNAASIEELAFGLSDDGSTWTILAKINKAEYQTEAGRAFQLEMTHQLLRDVIETAWRSACERFQTSAEAEF